MSDLEFKNFLSDLASDIISMATNYKTVLYASEYDAQKIVNVLSTSKTKKAVERKSLFYNTIRTAENKVIQEQNRLILKLSTEGGFSTQLSAAKEILNNFSYNDKEKKELEYNLLLLLQCVKTNVSDEQYTKILETVAETNITNKVNELDKLVE